MQSMLTLTQKAYKIWWYEQGWNKPKWRASMMSMDIIHVHAKEGGEQDKVKSNIAPGINDCLWMIHESHVVLNTRSQKRGPYEKYYRSL